MNRKELLREAILKYGTESQVFMAIEEMAELMKALSKYRRNKGTTQIENVIEEIADVRIMLEQLEIIFEPLHAKNGKTTTVNGYEEAKLIRLHDRLCALSEPLK